MQITAYILLRKDNTPIMSGRGSIYIKTDESLIMVNPDERVIPCTITIDEQYLEKGEK